MHPAFRRFYDAGYDPARFRRYAARVAEGAGVPGFRLAETPIFFDPVFIDRARAAAEAIIAQISVPEVVRELERAVPERFAVPERPALPSVAVIDFAATRNVDGSLAPKLVELQGFPSLVAFECVQGEAWIEALAEIPGLRGSWEYADGGREALLRLARETIVGDADPSEVVLLDIDPHEQKTRCDFIATKRLLGVAAVDPRELEVRGRSVVRRDAAGRTIPVRRIYNRMIFEEVERRGRTLPWDVREALDVTWVTHPDWYFMWSKFALPFLKHPAVPATHFVADVDASQLDLSRYVLKPLFSFAGGGVVLHPTLERVREIGADAGRDWCLQERITYDEVLPMADGGVKVEVRLMYLRPHPGAELRYATNLCRLSRGEMIGVDYNKDRPWTGSSIGLVPSAGESAAPAGN